jgi:arginase
MDIRLISSPFSLDQLQTGMGQAPEALLAAGLVEQLRGDGHRVSVAARPTDLGAGGQLTRIGRNLASLAQAVAETVPAGALPVILGGDCLVSIGVVAGLRRVLADDLGIAWFDAHGDFNTPETTISGYLGGMPLACCCGRGLAELRAAAGLTRPVAEAQVALLGVRDLDPAEAQLLDGTPVRRFPPGEVAHFTADARPTYLHFDVDALDLALAPGVNYPAPGGLILEAALAAARQVRPHLAAVSLTAVDPTRDPSGQTVRTGLAVLRGVLTVSGR